MLATKYLWMSTCECITNGGLLPTCVPKFHSGFYTYCSIAYQTLFAIQYQDNPVSYASFHSTFHHFNWYFYIIVKLRYIYEFNCCEIMHD